MKKILLTTAAILAVSTAANAVPDNSFPYWYLGLSAGGADQRKSDFKSSTASGNFKYKTGYEAGASIGYTGFSPIRVELEGTQHKQDFSRSGGDVKVNVGAFNGFYDFTNSSVITPYLGAGVGIGKFHLEGSNASGVTGDDTKLIYQGMFGVNYDPVSVPNVEFSLGYRYMAPFNDPKIGTGASKTKVEYDNHSVEAGAKFRF